MEDESPEVETYTCIAPGDEVAFSPSISVRTERETDYNSVEKLAGEEIEALCAEEGMEELARDDDFLLDQYPVEEVLLRWEVEGQVMFQRRHYTIIGEDAYTLVLTFTDETGAGAHPEGEDLLRGFDPAKEITWG